MGMTRMRKNRERAAALAAENRATALGTVGRNPAARPQTTPKRIGQGPRASHTSGPKGQGLWGSVSPSYRTAVTIDQRWSK